MGTRHTSGGKVDPRIAPAKTFDAFFPEWSQPLLDAGLESAVDDERTACTTDTGAGHSSTDDKAATTPAAAVRIDNDIPLEQQCQQILELLRKHCPDIIPSGPVPSGEALGAWTLTLGPGP